MNREERRNLGVSKESANRLDQLKSPCTVLEAVQLAQGVCDDSIKNYHEKLNPMLVSLSLQLELLKEMLFEGKPITNVEGNVDNIYILSEKDFIKRFEDKVEEYNRQRKEFLDTLGKENSSIPKTTVEPQSVEVSVEHK